MWLSSSQSTSKESLYSKHIHISMCYLTFNNDEQREKIKKKKKIKEILNMCEFFLDANKCLELCIKKNKKNGDMCGVVCDKKNKIGNEFICCYTKSKLKRTTNYLLFCVSSLSLMCFFFCDQGVKCRFVRQTLFLFTCCQHNVSFAYFLFI